MIRYLSTKLHSLDGFIARFTHNTIWKVALYYSNAIWTTEIRPNNQKILIIAILESPSKIQNSQQLKDWIMEDVMTKISL